MYHPGGNSSSSSCGLGMDGTRPDAVLANGAEFLPPSSYKMLLGHYSQQPPLLVDGAPRPSHHQQQLSFRRVLSTEDLGGEDGQSSRVVAPARYSAEERRERIEKYRSKRNHRNFQKKITYACRKTLADSRPRVKGRFARNDNDPAADYAELEASDAHRAAAATGIDHSESPPVNNIPAAVPEWWPAMQEALIDDDLDNTDNLCDDEMLAAYLGVSSITLCSPSSSSYSSPSASAWQ
ncbi:hypothetical protein ACP70R_021753 [Stipagrostis hirtigluma subsp. patula]